MRGERKRERERDLVVAVGAGKREKGKEERGKEESCLSLPGQLESDYWVIAKHSALGLCVCVCVRACVCDGGREPERERETRADEKTGRLRPAEMRTDTPTLSGRR